MKLKALIKNFSTGFFNLNLLYYTQQYQRVDFFFQLQLRQTSKGLNILAWDCHWSFKNCKKPASVTMLWCPLLSCAQGAGSDVLIIQVLKVQMSRTWQQKKPKACIPSQKSSESSILDLSERFDQAISYGKDGDIPWQRLYEVRSVGCPRLLQVSNFGTSQVACADASQRQAPLWGPRTSAGKMALEPVFVHH